MLVCLVTGTRDLTGAQTDRIIARFDALFDDAARHNNGLLMLHGGAKGVDDACERWVDNHPSKYVHSLVIKARWSLPGLPRNRAGGPIRNSMLGTTLDAFRTAENSVCAECFPGPESIGTHDMIARLRKLGIEHLTITDLFNP